MQIIPEGWGMNSASIAAKSAIECPLLSDISIDKAMGGVLVHFDIHPTYSLIEIDDGINTIKQNIFKDTDVILKQLQIVV